MEKMVMRCFLRIVSPVHIGCDEVYEPTGFSVNEKEGRLTVFDPLSFIAELSPDDKARFSAICRKGDIPSILEVYKFLRNHSVSGRKVEICTDFRKHYNDVLSLPKQKIKQELNKFTIYRTSFLSRDERPYIPGSAVKGALRTAYLNMLSRKGPDYSSYLKKFRGGRDKKDTRHKKLEQKLLKLDQVSPKEMISKDPFRLVKVSDFVPAGGVKTRIFYAVNKKKKRSEKDAGGPYQILETVLPGALFTGEITVDSPRSRDAVSRPVSLDELIESVRTFFSKEKKREDRELAGIGVPVINVPGNGDEYALRIGRHSGAESVTIERYRDIKIMLGKKGNTYQNHATTLWLASEFRNPTSNSALMPFGWTALGHLTPEMDTRLRDMEISYCEERMRRMEADRKRIAERERQKKEEAGRKAEEEKRQREKQQAEEEKKRKFEAMSPEEQNIALLEDLETNEQQVVEIFRGIDGLSGDNKKKLARALKERWMRSGKWEGKQSKKQMAKVRKIQGILGEN